MSETKTPETPDTTEQENGVDEVTMEQQTVAEEAAAETETQETEDIQSLKAKLTEAENKAQQNLDGWQRARAEFANYKKRMEQNLSESSQRAASELIVKLLPIIDDFERAIENVPEDLQNNSWVTGTALIGRKFDKLLQDNNIETIDPVGEPFDPNQHEAVGMDNSDEVESGHVTVTLQKGYRIGDRVLRAAMVRVAG